MGSIIILGGPRLSIEDLEILRQKIDAPEYQLIISDDLSFQTKVILECVHGNKCNNFKDIGGIFTSFEDYSPIINRSWLKHMRFRIQ